MRISDCSSDVCSSDLLVPLRLARHFALVLDQHLQHVLRLVAQVFAVTRQGKLAPPLVESVADVDAEGVDLRHGATPSAVTAAPPESRSARPATAARRDLRRGTPWPRARSRRSARRRGYCRRP